MDDHMSHALILLTYKGKALLMNKNNGPIDEEKHPWCFIGGIKWKQESFEHAMARQVEKETSIKIDKINYVSQYCYHAILSDDDVNRIERVENQLLDFFSPAELKKIFLSKTTAQFISEHGTLI